MEGLLKFIDDKIHMGRGESCPTPKRKKNEKNNRFWISPSSILPKQNEKRFRSFRFPLVFWPPGQLPKIDPTWRIILGLVSGLYIVTPIYRP